MKSFIYKVGALEIEVNVDDEDYEWVHELFLRNKNPLKALRDIEIAVLNEKPNERKN
jgi:hypothetical protein